MFPKCAQSFLCRAQILRIRSRFAVDLRFRLWYDNCVGSDFSDPFSFARVSGPRRLGAGRRHKEMTPDLPDRGSFLSLGINHWVTSLSLDQPGFVWLLESLPMHSCFFSLHCDWHLWKTEDEGPAGRCRYHMWYHLFCNKRIPYFSALYKRIYLTKNFCKNGIKCRKRRFWNVKCWLSIFGML